MITLAAQRQATPIGVGIAPDEEERMHLRIAASVVAAALISAVPASAHYVNGVYRADVSEANCSQVPGCQPEGRSPAIQQAPKTSGVPAELERIAQCETRGYSRGASYSARNKSGAGGRYQIMPQTWAAYGGSGDPAASPPAEQDRVATAIYNAQGPAPWVCKG